MRLICGFLRLDGAPADARLLDAMVGAMSGRLAPQIWQMIDGEAALAVLEFDKAATVFLPQGRDGSRIAADIRLDCRDDLAADLGLPHDTPVESLALAAVARWAEDTPERLHGEYALACWHPASHTLRCARDIAGTRPLCYAHRPGRLFAFASLPKGLHRSGAVPARVDLVAIGRLLANRIDYSDATVFEGIRWLRPGYSLSVTPAGLQMVRAWRPDPAKVGTWRGSPDDAAETLLALVEQAVSCRLPSQGPGAVHLSGGLDSSAIAVIAAHQLRTQSRALYAYSHLSPSFTHLDLRDEREFVDAVLAENPDIVSIAPRDPTSPELDDDLPSIIHHAIENEICADVASRGMQILLTGAGGDEAAAYNGSGVHATLLLQRRWRALASALKTRAALDGQSVLRTAARRVLPHLLPLWMLSLRRALVGRQPRNDALVFLAPAFRKRVRETFHSTPRLRSRPRDRIWMLSEYDIAARANNWSLLGARHGIAYSHPLLDRRIIDFALSLPLDLLVRDGYQRQPFRAAMTGILPDKVRLREGKFATFPHLPIRMANNKHDILARIAAVRMRDSVADLFVFDDMTSAVAALPEGRDAELAALGLNRGRMPSERQNRGRNAIRALCLAEHIARFG